MHDQTVYVIMSKMKSPHGIGHSQVTVCSFHLADRISIIACIQLITCSDLKSIPGQFVLQLLGEFNRK